MENAPSQRALGFPRLRRSIEVLRAVEAADKPFQMADWWVSANGDHENVDPFDCQTAKCWAGWAATDPELMTQGLKAEKEGVFWYIGHGEDVGWTALAEFFGITQKEALWIGDPEEYEEQAPTSADITIPMVVERIEKVMRDNGVEP